MSKHPTYVNDIHAALQSVDDFVTTDQLAVLLKGVPRSLFSTSLHHLKKHKLADVMVEGNVMYWYALPPTQDTRMFRVPEREDEQRPRKTKPRLRVVKSPE
jgi:hypothetical protein